MHGFAPHAEALALGEPSALAEQVFVRMADGVRLATDVYLPEGSTRPRPTVLIRLPYDKSAPFAFMEPISRVLTADGYAVVVQDVRGKARSEGATEAFVHEVADGHATLDWVVDQPWCDGRVAMFGDSYYGFTQWAAAVSGHPALVCMVPRVTSSDIGGDWMYDGGVFCLYTMAEWAIGTWVDNRLYHADIDWSVRPLDAILPAHHEGRRSASLDRWAALAPDDPAWTRGIYGTPDPLRRIAIPVLHSPGTYDVFRRGQLRDWAALRLGPAGGAQRLVLDATDHFDDQHPGDGEPEPDFLEDPAAFDRFLPRYLAPARAFLRAHLLGDGRDASAPVRVRVAHHGWVETTDWPPPGSAPHVWYLQPGGGLGAAASTSATLAWHHDPADLVPDPVADPWRPLLERIDEAPLHRRGDVHVFRAEPVERDLDLVGGASLLAVAAADADAASLIATLLDVHPDGRCERIAEGARRIGRAEDPAAIDFGPVAYRLRSGHALAVALAASMFPRYLPTLVASGDPWTAEPGAPIVHRVELGGSAGAKLLLSVLD